MPSTNTTPDICSNFEQKISFFTEFGKYHDHDPLGVATGVSDIINLLHNLHKRYT